MGYIIVLLLAAVLLAVCVNTITKKEISARVAGCAMVFAVIFGIILYSFGYYQTTRNIKYSVLRTALSVLTMFLGRNDFSSIKDSNIFATDGGVFLFWLAHFAAFFSSTNALLAMLGAKAMRRARQTFIKFGKLVIIFGTNNDAVALGKKYKAEKHTSVVFIDEKPDANNLAVIDSMGAIILSNQNAVKPNKRLIRSLGLRQAGKEVMVFALSEDMEANYLFADAFMNELQAIQYNQALTSLTIRGKADIAYPNFISKTDKYGYGYVFVFKTEELVARAMIKECPPWNTMQFDNEGNATTDFHCVIIGFGKTGKEVLKQLVANGQYKGSHFRADIFDADENLPLGKFMVDYRAMLDNYDIRFHKHDGRSIECFDFILENKNNIKYIAICAGPKEENDDVADEISEFVHLQKMKTSVFQCYHFGVKKLVYGEKMEHHSIINKENLMTKGTDKMAMILNHRYRGEGSAWTQWNELDYFSKMSCRAATDFFPGMLAAANIEPGVDVFNPRGKLLENLAETEHLRWVAFHYSMGYKPMTQEEWQERADKFNELKLQGEEKRYNVSKNVKEKTHACMISWDELEQLADKENRIIGKNVDYKQFDRENVLAIPELMAELEKKKK